VQARAGQIHRWDLSERSDNPAANVSLEGGWNTAMRSISAERLLVQTSKSNLRGSARFAAYATPAWEIRLDSAGIQAADLLAWYRAFDPREQRNCGRAILHRGGGAARMATGIGEAAFSSAGGEVRIRDLTHPCESALCRVAASERA